MAVLVAHGVAVFVMAWFFVWWASLAIVVLMGSAGLYDLRLKAPLITAIAVSETGYRLHDRGVWKSVELVSAFIALPLTVVKFRDDSGLSYFLTLLTDSLDADDYRHLRIHLRWLRDKP
ncbi:hypothetical protein SFSGTM_22240 [Sulfuriferula nivalis]|uniref:Uncharacterized protein n=1 Tax=Sulfuriferula nivalis TaxID=2675298 RepID=A0A809RIT8_9PROT|nr:hypothetical protein [Sulfuriferula nivalis]BBP01516.1 hypothetical protein SFSGTM_22240 [Sulfuriferula nivalis]